MSIRINDANFTNEVLENEKPILIDFWANWCGPCRMLSPIIEELESEDPSLRVGKIDVDMCPDLAMLYGIEAIPTLLYFKNGEVAAKAMGLQTKEQIKAMLK